ncbi:MAG: DUF4435 domain-containing protein [Paracoccaceae bacterium]|uniref:DUF4435 domain-containing protein n=1 Tax=Hyphomonas sp. TaxID=87 RepID=UPI003276ABA3
MTYLESLRARRKTPAAAWHKLRTSMSAERFDFFAVFEGEDDEEFFSHFLYQRFPDKKFRPIVCDGKGGVLALHQSAVAEYGEERNIFFFVDTDHDCLIGRDIYPAQTFSTCGYSIENYFYDSDTVFAGIMRHFRLNPADDLCKEIRTAFEHDRSLFERRSTPIMSYAVALRINDQDPKLDNFGLHALFDLHSSGIRKKPQDFNIFLRAVQATTLPRCELFRVRRLLKGRDPNEFFRGKFVASFVLNFCRKLAKRFENKPKLNGKPLKASMEFGGNSLVNAFIDYIDMPERLSSFFDTIDVKIQAT